MEPYGLEPYGALWTQWRPMDPMGPMDLTEHLCRRNKIFQLFDSLGLETKKQGIELWRPNFALSICFFLRRSDFLGGQILDVEIWKSNFEGRTNLDLGTADLDGGFAKRIARRKGT